MMEFLALVTLIQLSGLWALSGDEPAAQGVVGGYLAFMLVLSCLTLSVHAISPFLVFRLPWKYLSALIYLPAYAVWKLGVLFRGRPERWVSTREEAQALDASGVCSQGQV
jgi:hypothetical protein